MTRPAIRHAAAGIAAFALAGAGWLAAGWLVRLAGIGELDLPLRVGAVFLLLTLGEAQLARLAGPASGGLDDGGAAPGARE